MKEELITISPIDGSEFVRRPYASESQIQQTLQRAKTAQKAWAARPLSERLALVGQAVEHFVQNKAAIAEAITRQMGRPLRYTATAGTLFARNKFNVPWVAATSRMDGCTGTSAKSILRATTSMAGAVCGGVSMNMTW